MITAIFFRKAEIGLAKIITNNKKCPLARALSRLSVTFIGYNHVVS
jgi:hypothetical protein